MYSNNKEYRQAIRNIFNMNVGNIESEIKQYNYDKETEDELLFDEAAMSSGMTNILEKTLGNSLFDELYSLAAAKMISMDKETGLCILLSYDYLSDFYNVWNAYLENPHVFSEKNAFFILLKNRLGKR
jgi:hypothetical protein